MPGEQGRVVTSADGPAGVRTEDLPGGVAVSALVSFLGALHRPGEWFTVSAAGPSRRFSSRAFDDPVAAADFIGGLSTDLNVWHGVNPLARRPESGRGTAADVARLAALWADLDVKQGALASTDTAWTVIEDLSTHLAAVPSFVVASGSGGLHPYWLLEYDPRLDVDTEEARVAANAMLMTWFEVVASVCASHGAVATDNVYDLSRILRTPGSYNVKPGVMAPVTLVASDLYRVPVDLLVERLGVPRWGTRLESRSPALVTASTATVERHPAGSWPVAARTCAYARRLVEGIATDEISLGGSRHYWAASRLLRLWCAVRSGCVASGDVELMVSAVQGRLDFERRDAGRRPGRGGRTVGMDPDEGGEPERGRSCRGVGWT